MSPIRSIRLCNKRRYIKISRYYFVVMIRLWIPYLKIIKSICKPFIRSFFSEDFVCKKNYKSFIQQRKLHERLKNVDFLDLLTTVHIETRTRCNSLCSYCAANPKFDRRDDKCMTEETYRKIIDGLAEINYSRRVSPYCNNEPLLDDNIYSYVAYAREKLPNDNRAQNKWYRAE